MDKKPLIVVSICAVVLLVLGSLSNVVGYQSVKSTTVNNSPLFSMRTQRAINQQQNIITSQYLGKEKIYNMLMLPKPDKTDSIHEIISRIQSMDDVSFQRFVRYTVEQLSKQAKLKDVTPRQLITGLHHLRYNPQAYIDYINSNDENKTWKSTPTLCWFPSCILLKTFQLIIDALAWIILLLLFISPPPVTIYPPTFNDCYCMEENQ